MKYFLQQYRCYQWLDTVGQNDQLLKINKSNMSVKSYVSAHQSSCSISTGSTRLNTSDFILYTFCAFENAHNAASNNCLCRMLKRKLALWHNRQHRPIERVTHSQRSQTERRIQWTDRPKGRHLTRAIRYDAELHGEPSVFEKV